MKTKLELQIKEELEQASLHELMPDFDREQFWEALAPQLPKPVQKKAMIFRLPALQAAAAAVLVLVFTTWSILHFGTKAPLHHPAIAVQTIPPAPALSKPSALPAPTVAQSSPVPAVSKPASRPAVGVNSSVKVSTEAPADLPEVMAGTGPLGIPVQEPLPAAVPARRVVHYLDIAEEAPAPQVAAGTANTPLIRMRLNKPATEGQYQQQKSVKDVVLALGTDHP